MSVSRGALPLVSFGSEFKNGSPHLTICFSAFGISVGIRTNAPETVPFLIEQLPPGSKPTSAAPGRVYTLRIDDGGSCPPRKRSTFRGVVLPSHLLLFENPPERCFELCVEGVTLARTRSLAEILEIFESDVQAHVAEMCDERLFVHAGVVGWKGRAILIPGLSGSGKTTLVASLLRAGATYYSDEYAVLDYQGRVHPYARALSLRAGQESIRMNAWPEAFGAVPGAEPLPLGLIIVTRYHTGAHWNPRVLSPGGAVLALIANTVGIRRQPPFALATLQRAVSSVLTLESDRSEADRMPPLVFSQLEAHIASSVGG